MPDILALRRQRDVNDHMFEVTLGCIVCSRLLRPHCELLSLTLTKTKKLLSGILELRGHVSTGTLRMLQRSTSS